MAQWIRKIIIQRQVESKACNLEACSKNVIPLCEFGLRGCPFNLSIPKNSKSISLSTLKQDITEYVC